MKRRHVKIPTVLEKDLRKTKYKAYIKAGHNVIVVEKHSAAKCRMGSIIHEMLHFLDNDAGENWVVNAGHAITKALWRDGYRRIQP